MPHLTITKFTCIEKAEINLSPLTILIGPQASGKSVISKLFYFFINQIHNLPLRAADGVTPDNLSDILSTEFLKWFPPSAWGKEKFRITFEAKKAGFVVSRKRSNASPSNKVAVKLTPYLADLYGQLHRTHLATKKRSQSKTSIDGPVGWESLYRLRRTLDVRLAKDLENEFITYQLFIPAGRSFFTSIGKAIAAFEQGGILDPVTINFGRLFTSQREHFRDLYFIEEGEERDRHFTLMRLLFGGEIKAGRDSEYVETQDGRRIPFSFLSSGQQEVLPLWLTLGHFADLGIRRRSSRQSPSLVYIEEPEAHLFPSTQSILLDYLASLVAEPQLQRSMLLTTHSPYVLSKINNLIFAGQIAHAKKTVANDVAKVVPRTAWLPPGSVNAYSINERKVNPILDDDGLINGEYLDGISNDIAETFDKLIEIAEVK